MIEEKTILDNVEQVKTEAVRNITSLANREIDRINGVYTSVISAFKKLKEINPGLLDMFGKTNGNVRTADVETEYDNSLNMDYGGRHVDLDNLVLKAKKHYRIVVVVLELEK